MNRLLIPDGPDSRRLRGLLESPLETAAVLLADDVGCLSGSHRFIFRELMLAPADAYDDRSADSVRLRPAFIAWALKRARQNGWSVFLVHTHPWHGRVAPSKVDLAGESVMRPTLATRVPEQVHGRLILGHADYHAAIWPSESDEESPLRVFFVGSELRELPRLIEDKPQSGLREAVATFWVRGANSPRETARRSCWPRRNRVSSRTAIGAPWGTRLLVDRPRHDRAEQSQ